MLSAIFGVDRLPVLVSSHDDHSLMQLAIDVLHITEKQVAAVFEVGAIQPGDMLLCADLLRPTIAIITAICPAHLQGMEALHCIASEKQKIFSFFSPSQVGIVCGDYPVLAGHAYEHPVVRFGLKNKNVITARKITVFRDETGLLKTKIVLRVYDYEQEIILHGHHRGVIYAALAAATLAHFLYVPFAIVVRGLAAYVPCEGRFCERPLRDGRGVLIQDSYSISPESVKAAFHAIHAIGSTQRKIAVIGNIPDLGDKTNFWHRHVGRELIKTRSISDLVLVGEATKPIYTVAPATMNIWLASEWTDATETLTNLLAPRDNLVLVTGAVPHKMNRLVAQLT
jgi:murE/murF fusion protein